MNAVSKVGLALTAIACGLLGCASQKNGYGASLGDRNDAELRQQVADATVAPDSREFYLSLIEKMQRQGLYFASLAHIDEFEKKFGTAPDVRLLRGDALAKTEQPDQARAVYETLIDTKVAAPAWHGIGLVDAQRNSWPSAVAALQNAVERDPTNASFVSDLGFAYMKSGDLSNARVPLAQAAELAPNDQRIVGNLALYLMASGDDAAATAVMDKALFPLPMRDTVRAMAVQMQASSARRTVASMPKAALRTPPQGAPAATAASAARNSSPAGVPMASASVQRIPDAPVTATQPMKVRDQNPGPSAFSMQSMLDRFGRSN
ncbi:MAG: tetratricopeptide repeat protein [Janthinobacterium lividum]